MRILIISDVHANRHAFEAVLGHAVACDAVWHLGDIVGYGPDPAWCVDRLISLSPAVSLAGNHDLAATEVISSRDFNPLAERAVRWTGSRLSPDQHTYLKGLPAMSKIDGVTLAHGSPRDPVWEYIADTGTASDNFRHFTTTMCVVGHTHIPCFAEQRAAGSNARLRRLSPDVPVGVSSHRWIVNPGSVGQPRDGDSRAAYAIFDTASMTITGHRIAYDIALVQRRMRDAGLPEPLAHRLALGR